MATPTYKIILLGAMPDVTDVQAQAGFAKIFNLTPEQAAPLFAKPGRVLKSGLTPEQATNYVNKLARVGVACEMRDEAAPAAASAPPVTPPPVGPASRAKEQQSPASPRNVDFVFTGNGFEYFKIWIVNILLSIVTLGIYSAWAKVRNKQYFYGNTFLDDASFSYTANPVKILIGRIIAFVFLVVYSVAGQLSVIAGTIMGILLFVFLPWVICKSLRFNARYSSYRNVPFAFTGKVWGAACAFIFWPMLGFITLGILFPFAYYKQKHFIYGNHGYGTRPFSFSATVGSYYVVFLLTMAVCVLFALAAFFLGLVAHPILGGLLFSIIYLFTFAFFTVRVANINYNAITLKDHALRADWQFGGYLWLMVSNTFLIVLTLGLYIPWAKVRTASFKARYTSALFVGDMNEFAAQEHEKVNALAESVGDLFDIEIGF